MAGGSVWGVDIGKSTLKAVRMRRGKEELEIQTLVYYEYDFGDDGTIGAGESSRALERLVAEHPAIKKERVLVALPGHASFSRFIKLPAFDEKKLDEMVRFEAQQQIPFPIAEVNWDYALVDRDYGPDDDREVGLFAIKKDLVYGFLGDLQLSGLDADTITIAPLAIYNFVRYDMELPEKATVVLDIGWDHTDLVIIDGDRYWVRNLALNGHDLSKAIAARMKVSFGEAEKLKRDAANAKESRKLYTATELVLKDFVAEIHRSIGFYKAQNKDRQVQIGQILLLGSGSKLPNIRPFFQKELGYPVETLKRLSRLTLDVDVNPDEVELLKEHLATFAVAFGLGIQGCGEAPNNINLLPVEIQRQKALERKKPLTAAAVALLYVLVVVAYLLGSAELKRVDEVLGEADRNLKSLAKSKKERDAAMGEVPAAEERVKRLAAITANRTRILELLNKLAGALPRQNGALAELTAEQRKVLETQGTKIPAVEKVRADLSAAQGILNDGKTWILDVDVKATEKGARAVLLVARKYKRNAQGSLDETATLDAIKTGVLDQVRNAFPSAEIAREAPKMLIALEKEAVAPQGGSSPGGTFGTGVGAGDQRYLSVKIVIEYPEPEAGTSVAGGETR
jgi:type IV pilus assembly protein PilM